MNLEIERKFLVKDNSYLSLAQKKEYIKQGFLNSSKDRVVRIRIIKDTAFITVKGPSKDGLSRFEWEKEISLEDANALFNLCEPGIIEKTRYFHKTNDKFLWEIDVFHGENDGLVIAEVELESVNQSIQKPDYIGKEVTGEKKYYNAYLSKQPFNLWHKKTSN